MLHASITQSAIVCGAAPGEEVSCAAGQRGDEDGGATRAVPQTGRGQVSLPRL